MDGSQSSPAAVPGNALHTGIRELVKRTLPHCVLIVVTDSKGTTFESKSLVQMLLGAPGVVGGVCVWAGQSISCLLSQAAIILSLAVTMLSHV